MATKQVDTISEVRQKNGTSYDSYYVAPEVRHVGSSRKSGNNNLEEQLILGTDRVKTFWIEDGVKRGRVAYTDDEESNEYYVLDSYFFDHGSSGSEVYFNNNTLYFSDPNRAELDNLDPELLLFYNDNDNYFIYTHEQDPNGITICPTVIKREDVLRYKQSDDTVQDISRKETSYKEYREDDNSLIKKVSKEKIYSLL